MLQSLNFHQFPAAPGSLILDEEFSSLNFARWKHELTMEGGGNWEFQVYQNNRSTTYVKDGILYIKPGLLTDFFGENGETIVRFQMSYLCQIYRRL